MSMNRPLEVMRSVNQPLASGKDLVSQWNILSKDHWGRCTNGTQGSKGRTVQVLVKDLAGANMDSYGARRNVKPLKWVRGFPTSM